MPSSLAGETPATRAGKMPAPLAGETPASRAGKMPAPLAGETPAPLAGKMPATLAGKMPATRAVGRLGRSPGGTKPHLFGARHARKRGGASGFAKATPDRPSRRVKHRGAAGTRSDRARPR